MGILQSVGRGKCRHDEPIQETPSHVHVHGTPSAPPIPICHQISLFPLYAYEFLLVVSHILHCCIEAGSQLKGSHLPSPIACQLPANYSRCAILSLPPSHRFFPASLHSRTLSKLVLFNSLSLSFTVHKPILCPQFCQSLI
jgi:hypothetical protein